LEARHVSKRYGTCVANNDVNLLFPAGTIHGLVGENGAGKSTLCKTLFGLVRPDAGQVLVDGQPVLLRGPRDAMARGVGMVHQHFMLVPTLTVAENTVLGAEPTRRGLLDLTRAEQDVQDISQRFGLAVDPRARVQDLPVGVQQRVEILKVLHRGARTLILDEPTAVLTPAEVDRLFDVLKSLRSQGWSVLLVTHKLPEVLALCDAVTVMRAGRTVAQEPLAGATVDHLARLMVGRAVDLSRRPASGHGSGEVRLSVRGLRVRRPDGRRAVDGVSLEVRAGQVVGIAGVEGNGQKELCDAVTGVTVPEHGEVNLLGRDVTRWSVRDRRTLGLAHVPEDRLTQGLIPSMRLFENAALGSHRGSHVNRRGGLGVGAMRRLFSDIASSFDVRPRDADLSVGALSGGNQQKLLVGRELRGQPRVLLLAQPTRGVDVGAVERIHAAIRQAREDGVAILLVSAELTELLALSDVIHVLYRGRLVHQEDGALATPESLGPSMLGGSTP
jgi:simple sugar transport system ATP-binding protein